MGSIGKTVGKTSVAESTAYGFRSITKKSVSNWMEEQQAGDFLGVAPDSVTINGIQFNWFDGHSEDYGDKYVNYYQSTEQTSNGEYPVLETVVIKKKVRGRGMKNSYTWEFDKSTFGTRLT